MASRERVIIGISGGVDSAVAALRLSSGGFDVHGLHMTNWDEDDAYCTAADDYQAARRVCADLDIPLHRVDLSAEYRREVFTDFLKEYAAGRTPNPDVLCNRHIKFGSFMEYAARLGARRIATGHYARLANHGGMRLLKAADPAKDQTYFLHAVNADALERAIFPIGGFTKAEVRRMANDAGLPNYNRPDSTGICFIGERPFKEFLGRYLSGTAGPIVAPDGTEVGQHDGLMFYTVGQRSGLGIGGPGEPWYVVAKDTARNTLLVAQGRKHPWLWSVALHAGPARWIHDAPETLQAGGVFHCEARIRHRQHPAPCAVRLTSSGMLYAQFDQPQWAVTPGQYAVFYHGEECLGGAIIESSSRSREFDPADAEALA
jgi:tRNA-specific 2-thiouridylase